MVHGQNTSLSTAVFTKAANGEGWEARGSRIAVTQESQDTVHEAFAPDQPHGKCNPFHFYFFFLRTVLQEAESNSYRLFTTG